MLVMSDGLDAFRNGWSWNTHLSFTRLPNGLLLRDANGNIQRTPHNHWSKGPDGAWGVKGVDEDEDGQVDNANFAPFIKFEPGNGDDVSLQHVTHDDWPKDWTLPNPLHGLNPLEAAAINAANDEHGEHDNAMDDWSDPGKNHATKDKYDD